MAISKKQQASVHKYVRENYDRIELTAPKGRKETLQSHAKNKGESLNGFVNRAIDEQMTRDNQGETALTPTTETLKEGRLILDIFGYDPESKTNLYVDKRTDTQYLVEPVKADVTIPPYSDEDLPF